MNLLPFIQDLDLTDDEREKLVSLATSSPFALLSLREASPQAFDSLLGADRAAAVANQLSKLLSPEEQKLLQKSQSSARRFGARLPE